MCKTVQLSVYLIFMEHDFSVKFDSFFSRVAHNNVQCVNLLKDARKNLLSVNVKLYFPVLWAKVLAVSGY